MRVSECRLHRMGLGVKVCVSVWAGYRSEGDGGCFSVRVGGCVARREECCR